MTRLSVIRSSAADALRIGPDINTEIAGRIRSAGLVYIQRKVYIDLTRSSAMMVDFADAPQLLWLLLKKKLLWLRAMKNVRCFGIQWFHPTVFFLFSLVPFGIAPKP